MSSHQYISAPLHQCMSTSVQSGAVYQYTGIGVQVRQCDCHPPLCAAVCCVFECLIGSGGDWVCGGSPASLDSLCVAFYPNTRTNICIIRPLHRINVSRRSLFMLNSIRGCSGAGQWGTLTSGLGHHLKASFGFCALPVKCKIH